MFGNFATLVESLGGWRLVRIRSREFSCEGQLWWLMGPVVSSSGSSYIPSSCRLSIPQSVRGGIVDGAVCRFGVLFASVMMWSRKYLKYVIRAAQTA